MILGFAKETYPGERRVALVPSAIPGLKKAGYDLVMEAKAGELTGFSDREYEEKGVRVLPTRQEVFKAADIVLFVQGPGGETNIQPDFNLMRRGQVIIGMLDPSNRQDDIKRLTQIGVTAFSLELLPRITRAQSMDVLSSIGTIAGYKAVILAADALPKMFPLLMTAAGTISPARVFVIGAGVAGLQAIATAKRLGAVVQAYDIRPSVKEQVESLSAKFVELPLEAEHAEEKTGYARAMDEEFYEKQRQLMEQIVAESDVVITTASVPGKKAPVLITADMVRRMRDGSVIIDLAAAQGGNCEVTRVGETTTLGTITIIGPVNLAAAVPFDASQMYARNISNFLLHIVDKNGRLKLDADDEIIRETMVTRGGSGPRVGTPVTSGVPGQ